MKIDITKGYDLKIVGGIATGTDIVTAPAPQSVAIYPEDFSGFIPKACVEAGTEVMAGAPLLHHKEASELCLTSPVSGKVREVVRGARRRILCVVVDNDFKDAELKFDIAQPYNPEKLRELLAKSGLMAMMRLRPFDIIVRPDSATPRDIFVTAFDSAPLAAQPSYDATLLTRGVEALSTLTTGKVYISRREGSIADIPGAVMVDVSGPHPAGNAGVQIANIAPVSKGESVWTMSARTLERIGYLLANGTMDYTTRVAVTGSEVPEPKEVATRIGAPIQSILTAAGVTQTEGARIISGNVLTGSKVDSSAFIHAPYTQITIIPEGSTTDEFMGWASLSPRKMSISPSFSGWWRKKLFKPDARLLGGRRAMIMSGQIDSVLPMDIMGEYLIKAIEGGDIDRMEQLGIYEVAPEDFALAECLDSSKMPLQHIIRKGIEQMLTE